MNPLPTAAAVDASAAIPTARARFSNGTLAALVFACVLALFFLIDGNRFTLGNMDEGIYLDGAERIVHGEKVYVDFFGYMAPGTFCLQALLFQVLGLTMVAGRIEVLFFFALQCGTLFWLTARLSSRLIAGATTICFILFISGDPGLLTSQHRWDSAAISLFSIALLIAGIDSGGRIRIAAAGALIALAAFFTPTIGAIGIVTIGFLYFARELRRFLLPYVTAALLTGGLCLAILAATGTLMPFVNQMIWLQVNYSGVNRVPYGAMIGGYRDLLGGLSSELLVRAPVVFCLALPAILPIANALGLLVLTLWQRDRLPTRPIRVVLFYLLACSAALVFSAFPRPDVIHLGWVSAATFCLSAALCYWSLPKWAAPPIICILTLGMFLLSMHLMYRSAGLTAIASPIGTIRVEKEDLASVQSLLQTVHPGDSAYVYPYRPVLYFLTQTRNPTPYSYLAPGMMNATDEARSLAALQANPPIWILYDDISPEQFLRVFPNGDVARLHFRSIESWIRAHYAPAEPRIRVSGHDLLRRVDAGR